MQQLANNTITRIHEIASGWFQLIPRAAIKDTPAKPINAAGIGSKLRNNNNS